MIGIVVAKSSAKKCRELSEHLASTMLAGVLHRKRIDMISKDQVQFDAHTYILLAIFWETNWRPDGPIMSAQGFIDKHRRDIWDTCKVLEVLGLAVPDGKSPLNWRPTSDLIDLVTLFREAPECGQVLATDTEQEALPAVLDVLAFIGLLKRADDGEWMPTRQLRKLAAERCLIPRDQPRHCNVYAGD
jgi:hypothetical protein